MVKDIKEMKYVPEVPKTKRPIVSIAIGGIVTGCHYPAYKLAGFEVIGIYDINNAKAEEVSKIFKIPFVANTIKELVKYAEKYNAVFDIATPASDILGILKQLPDNSGVLMQKPMGESIEEAKAILNLCREKKIVAGVNFQLRQAPYIIAARKLIADDIIGDIYEVEVKETIYTPWHLWDFLFVKERMEINYHSIHFIDVIRSFIGNPKSVYSSSIKHPKMSALSQSRTCTILNYGDEVRGIIDSNHIHNFGLEKQESYLKIEGSKGAIKFVLGVLMNYPAGVPDKFEYISLEDKKGWRELEIKGTWFPEAFIGTMGGLMKKLENPSYEYMNDVEEAYKTMLVVEAAYVSSESGGVKVLYD